MRIKIELELYEEHVDPDHEMGVTEDAHLALLDALSEYGEIVSIRRTDG